MYIKVVTNSYLLISLVNHVTWTSWPVNCTVHLDWLLWNVYISIYCDRTYFIPSLSSILPTWGTRYPSSQFWLLCYLSASHIPVSIEVKAEQNILKNTIYVWVYLKILVSMLYFSIFIIIVRLYHRLHHRRMIIMRDERLISKFWNVTVNVTAVSRLPKWCSP